MNRRLSAHHVMQLLWTISNISYSGLQDKILANYHQAAHASSTRLGEILERVMDEELVVPDQEPGHVINAVVFVGRLCYYLSLSCCIRDLCYQDETADGDPVYTLVQFCANMTTAFKETLNGLHARSIKCWRDHAISKALTECDLMFVPFSPAPAPGQSITKNWLMPSSINVASQRNLNGPANHHLSSSMPCSLLCLHLTA